MRSSGRRRTPRASTSAARASSRTKDQLDAALLEYRRALELDGSNRLAAARAIELEKTIRDRIEATRPQAARSTSCARRRGAPATPLLNPTAPLPVVSFGPNASVRDILNFIGTATGINVTYDQAYQDKAYTVRLEDVTLEQALQQIMAANQLFYKVLNPKTIIVVPDNAQKHAQYDELVVRMFYISHADVVGAGAGAQHDHAHPDDAGAADAAAEQDGEHDHRAGHGADRRRDRADHPGQRQAARRSRRRRPDPRGQQERERRISG